VHYHWTKTAWRASHASRRNSLQTAWRAAHAARRHAPTISSLHHHRLADTTSPLGALLRRHRLAQPSHAARRPARTVTTITDLFPIRLTARSRRQALY